MFPPRDAAGLTRAVERFLEEVVPLVQQASSPG
jgi:hypothetical protein